jgi:sucrose-6-phosphate hydrolase SacC (GH32 family)
MAEDNEERFKVSLFDGNNYENWKFRMECFLDEKNLQTLVKSEPLYEEPAEGENAQQLAARQQRNDALPKKDKRCKNMIVQKIAESHIEYAMNKVSAYEV